MTTKELKFVTDYIRQQINIALDNKTDAERETLRVYNFADRYMQLINGQQMLPQSVFRRFLQDIDFSRIEKGIDKAEGILKDMSELSENLITTDQIMDLFNDSELSEVIGNDLEAITSEEIRNIFEELD